MTEKKKWIAIAGLFVVTFVLMFFYARQMRQNRMQKDIAKEILRLHVVANSDSKKDQALKMEVKEAVVTYLRGVMQDAESVDEARIQIQKRLPEIEAVAKEKMQQKGYSYDADATLSSCYFPVKTYGDMIFPAGEYEALKVRKKLVVCDVSDAVFCGLHIPDCAGRIQEKIKEMFDGRGVQFTA